MVERVLSVDHTQRKQQYSSALPSIQTCALASMLTLIGNSAMHHPPNQADAGSHASEASNVSPSEEATVMATMYSAPLQAPSAPPTTSSISLAAIEPKTDLLNQRFVLEGDKTPVGIDLEEDQCTLVVGDTRLRIVSTKDVNGKVHQLDKKTVQQYGELCHLQRTKKGIRAFGVIIRWIWEPSFELSDAELKTLKEKILAALKEKDPNCADMTITLQRGNQSIEVVLEYPPEPFEQLAAAGAVDSR